MGQKLRRGRARGRLPRTARIDGARDDRDRGGDDRRDVPAQRPGRRAGAAVQRADGGAPRQYRQLPEAALLPAPERRSLLARRSEEHTPELQSLMRIPYAVFFLKNKTSNTRMPTFVN